MIEEVSTKLCPAVDSLKFRIQSSPGGFLIRFISPCFEEFFKSKARVDESGKPAHYYNEAWKAEFWDVAGLGTFAIPGIAFNSEQNYFYHRENDLFNLYPLLAVGVGEGKQFLVTDLFYDAEMDTLRARYRDLIKEFYVNYLQPIDTEVTFTFTREHRAA